MKFLALSAVVALAACVSAKPAGHVDLAKRAIIATQTLVVGGTTQVQVVDAVEATVNEITTVTKTVTATETDATYVFSYSGDDSSIISRLQSALSEIIVGDDEVSEEPSSEDSSSEESSSEESSSDESSSEESSSEESSSEESSSEESSSEESSSEESSSEESSSEESSSEESSSEESSSEESSSESSSSEDTDAGPGVGLSASIPGVEASASVGL